MTGRLTLNSPNPRELAYKVLGKVAEGGFSDLALDAELGRQTRLDPRDRGLVTELVYGVLRQQGRLDYALSRFCNQPLLKMEERVRRLLRLGAYQILCLDRVPASAAVNTTVELARQQKLERATGFINGILRALIRGIDTLAWPDRLGDPQAYLSHACSLPGWLAKLWLLEFGADEACALAEAMLLPAPLTIRVNTLRAESAEVLAQLQAIEPAARRCDYVAEGIRLGHHQSLQQLAPGTFQVQDQASMLIPHLLDARPGERILDGCAAPGGKTTQMAALTGNRAEIVALDLHPQRIKLLQSGVERLGCQGITAKTWDLTRRPEFLAPASFDRILLDAPCSGLGVLRRNPEARWNRRPEDIAQLSQLQLRLLRNVAPLLKPGGVLVYSLCTTTPEETTGVVETFLEDQPQFQIEDLHDQLPTTWRSMLDAQGYLRTLPQHHDGMDAFFAVRLQRRS
jgi:16S rRNA (cytosine967-C5)-methyltransferase